MGHRRHPDRKLTIEGRRVLVGKGWPVARAAEARGCSRATAHKWLARQDAEGDAGLEERFSRPDRTPGGISGERE